MSDQDGIREGVVTRIETLTRKRVQIWLEGEGLPLTLDTNPPRHILLGDRVVFSGMVDHDGMFAASAYANLTQHSSGDSTNRLIIIVAIIAGVVWLGALIFRQHHPIFFALLLLMIYLTRLYWGQRKGVKRLQAYLQARKDEF